MIRLDLLRSQYQVLPNLVTKSLLVTVHWSAWVDNISGRFGRYVQGKLIFINTPVTLPTILFAKTIKLDPPTKSNVCKRLLCKPSISHRRVTIITDTDVVKPLYPEELQMNPITTTPTGNVISFNRRFSGRVEQHARRQGVTTERII